MGRADAGHHRDVGTDVKIRDRLKSPIPEALGAEVVLFDGDTAARWAPAYRIADERGLVENEHIVAGM